MSRMGSMLKLELMRCFTADADADTDADVDADNDASADGDY